MGEPRRPSEDLEKEKAALERSLRNLFDYCQTDHVGVAESIRAKQDRIKEIDAELAAREVQAP